MAAEVTADALASDYYREQLRTRYRSPGWGASGASHAPEVAKFAGEIGARSVLDYGCGRGCLKPALPGHLSVSEYDPGIVAKADLPAPVDLVVATDVLEHIEPDKLDAVLRHTYLLATRGAFFTIALKLAREVLPDGRNAHLIVKPTQWWLDQLSRAGWRDSRWENRKGLWVWLKKP